MKKNISINISGIIFNIEEDGYEQLKAYLDEINRYFAAYDETGEVAADIENRIAEIFLSKLSPQKQVITETDVQNLIVQMGNIRDFEALENPEGPSFANGSYQQSGWSTYEEANTSSSSYEDARYAEAGTPPPADKRLYRDGSRKIIAGVASGIASYFGIDPLWIRMLFAMVLLDLFMTFVFSSTLFLGYIIVWIIVPERYDIAKEKKVKKVFRNPDDRIVGGVAGGLAAYFGIDPLLIRILFFISVFLGGSGLIAYAILWAIMPEAKTLTDRMQMQGEPLTLSNIEQNIKKNLNLRDGEANGRVVKAVLFPFRFAATIIAGAGRTLVALIVFIAHIARVVAGIGLILAGFIFLTALIFAVCFATGYIPEMYLDVFDLHIPSILAQQSLPPLLLASSFFTLLIPGLTVILLGMAVLAKRWLLPAAAGWLLFAFWIISFVTVAVAAPPYAMNFRTQGYYETSQAYDISPAQILFINLQETDGIDYEDVSLSLQPGQEPQLRLINRFYAQGKNREDAAAIAGRSEYATIQKGDTLLLSRHLQIPENVPYRIQSLKSTLFIPAGQKFKMDYSLRKILSNNLEMYGFSAYDLRKDLSFQFNENGELECLNCDELTLKNAEEARRNNHTGTIDGATGRIEATDFSEVEVGYFYETEITQAPEYSIRLEGDRDAIDKLVFKQSGDKISFKSSQNNFEHQDLVKIYISLPELESLKISGASSARLNGWKGDDLHLKLSGNSRCELSGDFQNIEIESSGNSKINMQGTAESVEARLSGLSKLDAFDLRSTQTSLTISGASSASVNAEEQLGVNASGASQVHYKGNATAEINKSGAARVKKN